MSTILLFVAVFLGSIVALFNYWRRFREDYPSPVIFESGILVLAGSIIGALLFQFILRRFVSDSYFFDGSGLWFWGGVVGFITMSFFIMFQMKIRFYEAFEALGVGFMYLLLLVLISLKVFVLAVTLMFTLVIYHLINAKYKSFTWYKSGRVGFAGLTTFGLFFVARAVIAVASFHMVSFVGIIDAMLSALVAFLLFFSVYNLSS